MGNCGKLTLQAQQSSVSSTSRNWVKDRMVKNFCIWAWWFVGKIVSLQTDKYVQQ